MPDFTQHKLPAASPPIQLDYDVHTSDIHPTRPISAYFGAGTDTIVMVIVRRLIGLRHSLQVQHSLTSFVRQMNPDAEVALLKQLADISESTQLPPAVFTPKGSNRPLRTAGDTRLALLIFEEPQPLTLFYPPSMCGTMSGN